MVVNPLFWRTNYHRFTWYLLTGFLGPSKSPFRYNNPMINTSPIHISTSIHITPHERHGHLPSNFVPKGFGRDDGGFLTDTLVGMEIHCQTSVVLLDDDLSGLFHCLCTHTTLQICWGIFILVDMLFTRRHCYRDGWMPSDKKPTEFSNEIQWKTEKLFMKRIYS